jgi:hypothetical protein
MKNIKSRRPGELPMKPLARSSLVLLSIAAALFALVQPAAAESDEGFFTRLFNRGKPESTEAPAKTQQTLDCPEVRVTSGESSLRVGGPESTSVRHQFSVGDVARECAVAGKQLTIKVGVKGRVVLGPAGSPGSYSAPLRVGVRQQQGEKILVSKVFNVGATIAPGMTGADFIVVTEPFTVPFTTEHAADDYEVVVAFGKDAKAAPVEKRKRRQARPAAAASQD